MEFEKLTPELQLLVEQLKNHSSTIQNDVGDALEDASNEDDFKARAIGFLEDLKTECDEVIEQLTR